MERRTNKIKICFQVNSNTNSTGYNIFVPEAIAGAINFLTEQGDSKKNGSIPRSWNDVWDTKVFGTNLGVLKLIQIVLDVASMVIPEPTTRAGLTGLSTAYGAIVDGVDPSLSKWDVIKNAGLSVGSYAFTNLKFEKIRKILPSLLNWMQKGSILAQLGGAKDFAMTVIDGLCQKEKSLWEYIISHTGPDDLQSFVNVVSGIKGQAQNYSANKKADIEMSNDSRVKTQYVDAVDSNGNKKTVAVNNEDYMAMKGKPIDEQNAYLGARYENDVKLTGDGVVPLGRSLRVEGLEKEGVGKIPAIINPSNKFGDMPSQSTKNPNTEFVEPQFNKKDPSLYHDTPNNRADRKIAEHNENARKQNENPVVLTPKSHSAGNFSGNNMNVIVSNGKVFVSDPGGMGTNILLKPGYTYGFDGTSLNGSTVRRPSKFDVTYKSVKEKVVQEDPLTHKKKNVEVDVMMPEVTIDGYANVQFPKGTTAEQANKMVEELQKYFGVQKKEEGGVISKYQEGGVYMDSDIANAYNKYRLAHPWTINLGNKNDASYKAGYINNQKAGYHAHEIDKLTNSDEFKQFLPWFNNATGGRDNLVKMYPNFVKRGEAGMLPEIVQDSDGVFRMYYTSPDLDDYGQVMDASGNVVFTREKQPFYTFSSDPSVKNIYGQQPVTSNSSSAQQSVKTGAESNAVQKEPVSGNNAKAAANPATANASVQDSATANNNGAVLQEKASDVIADVDKNVAAAGVADDKTATKVADSNTATTVKNTASTTGATSSASSQSTATQQPQPSVSEAKSEEVADRIRTLDTKPSGGKPTGDALITDYGRSGFTGYPGMFPLYDIMRPLPAASAASAITYAAADLAKRYHVDTYENNYKNKTVLMHGDLGKINSALSDSDAMLERMGEYVSTDMDKNMNARYGLANKFQKDLNAAYAADSAAWTASRDNAIATVDANRNAAIANGNKNQKTANDRITENNKITGEARITAMDNMYNAGQEVQDRAEKWKNYVDNKFGPAEINALTKEYVQNRSYIENSAKEAIKKSLAKKPEFKGKDLDALANKVWQDKINGIPINYQYWLDGQTNVFDTSTMSQINSFYNKFNTYLDPEVAANRFLRNMTSRFAGAWDTKPLSFNYKGQGKN